MVGTVPRVPAPPGRLAPAGFQRMSIATGCLAPDGAAMLVGPRPFQLCLFKTVSVFQLCRTILRCGSGSNGGCGGLYPGARSGNDKLESDLV